jgi:hypothetical protein
MEALDRFFDKAHLFKVYLVGVLITGLFTFFLFHYVTRWITDKPEPILNIFINIKMSIGMGLIFGLLFMLMITGSRRNTRFWRYAETIEKLIDDAETKQALKDIYANEFKELRHLAQGGPHYQEAKRIYAILETKHKYIKD